MKSDELEQEMETATAALRARYLRAIEAVKALEAGNGASSASAVSVPAQPRSGKKRLGLSLDGLATRVVDFLEEHYPQEYDARELTMEMGLGPEWTEASGRPALQSALPHLAKKGIIKRMFRGRYRALHGPRAVKQG